MHHSRESVNASMAAIETADQQKAATAIMNWSNNLVRFRVISVTKCFYKWKYFIPPQVVSSSAAATAAATTTSVDILPSSAEKVVLSETATMDNEEIAEQKHSYLMLFAENEKLREQLTDLRKSTASKEKKLRVNAMKSCISVILRSRCTSKLRYYYDVWIHTTKSINLMNTTTQRTLQLDVGLQRVESERNYVKQLEHTNATLRRTLVYTVFFYKWKLNSALAKLASERRASEVQRQNVFSEIQRIREVVAVANNQEVALLHDALGRGDKLSGNIISLKEHVNAVLAISNGTKTSTATTTSALPAPPAAAASTGKSSQSQERREHSYRHHNTSSSSRHNNIDRDSTTVQ